MEKNITEGNTKDTVNPRDILCFSDVMDNLSDFKEIDIVPNSYIKMLKEDKSKFLTIIEYSSSQIAVIDNNLLICNESLEKYYKICCDILIEFRQRLQGLFHVDPKKRLANRDNDVIDENLRKKFLDFFSYRNWTYELIDAGNTKESLEVLNEVTKGNGYDKKRLEEYGMDQMYLKIVELASKILLCFNGEFNMAYNARLDLFMLGFLKDFHNELKIVNLSLKKFRKCYVGWYYRRILYSICFVYQKDKFLRSAKSKDYHVESKDFGRMKLLWEEEYDRLMEANLTKKRSYKLWEYLSLFQFKMKNEITEILMDGEKEGLRTETEIFLIEIFLNFYEKAKKICKEDIHNNCAFEYLNTILRFLFDMRINEFMDDEDFYKNFLEDHKYWVNELLRYHETINIQNKEERRKWTGLTMIDYSKLESLKAHKYVVDHWNEYTNFCKMVSR